MTKDYDSKEIFDIFHRFWSGKMMRDKKLCTFAISSHFVHDQISYCKRIEFVLATTCRKESEREKVN